MLVRNLLSDKIDIPHESGQWMQFRRLNGRRIAECMDRRQADAMTRMKALGSDGLAMIRDAAAGKDKNDPVADVKSDPMGSFDRETLLLHGIAAWSYDADVKAELASEDGGLDPITSDWAALEILRFNKLIPEEQETNLGN